MALAPSTKRVYQSAQKHFLEFCMAANLTPLPLSKDFICYYVAFLGEQGLKHSSIKSYLSSLRHMQISYGLEDRFTATMPQLEQVVKGIKLFVRLHSRGGIFKQASCISCNRASLYNI